ncbi:MAG: hypothetical protein ACXVPU_19140 [Bacteroidia bacterium]
MKKAGIILLLFVFLFNTIGYYIVFKAEQWQLQDEISAQIRSGSIPDSDPRVTKIIINRSELKNEGISENDDEITYKEHLYDVAKVIKNKTSITFYCINDTREESLLAGLDNHIQTNVANLPVKDQGSKKATDTIIKVYFSTKAEFSFASVSSDYAFSPVNSFYLSAQRQTATPPPPEFC